MTTTPTHGPLIYDGFGINMHDEYKSRILTWAKHDTNAYVLEEEERKRLGPLLASAPTLYAALKEAREHMRGFVQMFEADKTPTGKLLAKKCDGYVDHYTASLAAADGREQP